VTEQEREEFARWAQSRTLPGRRQNREPDVSAPLNVALVHGTGKLTFRNDSNLPVTVRVASDPDVSITQNLDAEERKLVAIELKGGTDVSNIWNRLGEAEKSHSKAKADGFNELWTVTRVDLNSDPETRKKAKRQSASTTRFFFLDRIPDPTSAEAISFRQVLGSIMGVKLAP
jgi:hypothetical protein